MITQAIEAKDRAMQIVLDELEAAGQRGCKFKYLVKKSGIEDESARGEGLLKRWLKKSSRKSNESRTIMEVKSGVYALCKFFLHEVVEPSDSESDEVVDGPAMVWDDERVLNLIESILMEAECALPLTKLSALCTEHGCQVTPQRCREVICNHILMVPCSRFVRDGTSYGLSAYCAVDCSEEMEKSPTSGRLRPRGTATRSPTAPTRSPSAAAATVPSTTITSPPRKRRRVAGTFQTTTSPSAEEVDDTTKPEPPQQCALQMEVQVQPIIPIIRQHCQPSPPPTTMYPRRGEDTYAVADATYHLMTPNYQMQQLLSCNSRGHFYDNSTVVPAAHLQHCKTCQRQYCLACVANSTNATLARLLSHPGVCLQCYRRLEMGPLPTSMSAYESSETRCPYCDDVMAVSQITSHLDETCRRRPCVGCMSGIDSGCRYVNRNRQVLFEHQTTCSHAASVYEDMAATGKGVGL